MHLLEAVPVFSPASPQAKVIVDFFYVVLGICGVILAIVTGLIVISLVRFRSAPGSTEPAQTVGNKRIEFAWTIIPLLIVLCLFVLTARAMNQSDPVPRELHPDLVVTGHQWWWEARYPGSGAATANEIHVPVGRRLLVRLESADVIHDFWAPRLGRKVDAVPGHPNYVWLQPSQAGTYLGACAEYCGTEHAWMRFLVIAEPPAEFEQWQQHQSLVAARPASEAAQRGAQVFQQMTCANCHAIAGTAAKAAVAPDLTHVASRRTLAAGVLENSPRNLAAWLADPQKIKPGALMPNLQLTPAQVSDLLAYLEELK